MQEAEQNPEGLFATNLFGKSLWELVNDGVSEKLGNMPPEARQKMGQTLARIINEGSGGLICIIL
jgi:stage IV sporulation protein A